MTKNIKVLKGLVISNKMDKTCTILIERFVKHKVYGKFIKRNIKFKVHDEHNVCKLGDVIEISECKPISKTKFWKFVKLVRK
ncbi:30S ribosomal protein S17 [Buchnera aphidicola (Chaitoregma tattakana)]|uniref:30S ribosomal protein S17 n=1 Tax=Buchnera aphidicola TaxID=9 RepID=UPI0031B7F6B4